MPDREEKSQAPVGDPEGPVTDRGPGTTSDPEPSEESPHGPKRQISWWKQVANSLFGRR